MLAPFAVRSIDALIVEDPCALENADLKVRMHELAAARARLDAAEAASIDEFDKRCLYVMDGQVNTRAWLAQYTGVSRKIAGARVMLGRHLSGMPLFAKALGEGRITAQHVTTLGRRLSPRTRTVFARDEAMLVGYAYELEADDFDVLVTKWLSYADPDGPTPEAPEPSEMSVSITFDNRGKIDGDFAPEDMAEIGAELEAIADELWREEQAAPEGDPIRERTRKQRYGEALVEMARRSSSVRASDPDSEDHNARPRRPQFIVRVDYDAVNDRITNGVLDDGTLIRQSTLERWACDSSLAAVLMDKWGQIIDLGTATYTPSAAQRRGLIARDGGCIVPGCKRRPRWCDAHHVVPFPKGPTHMSNLVLLCRRHHKQVHQGVIRLIRDDPKARWTVVRADGTPLLTRPPPVLVT